jgi:hypothetical protein
MKLAIAAFSTALVLATGVQAEVDIYERQQDAQSQAGHAAAEALNYVTRMDGTSQTGHAKFETVFSGEDRAQAETGTTVYKGR